MRNLLFAGESPVSISLLVFFGWLLVGQLAIAMA